MAYVVRRTTSHDSPRIVRLGTRKRATDEVLTTGEVAKLFRVDPRTVVRWETDGLLRSFRTAGGHRRFLASDIEKLVQHTSRRESGAVKRKAK